MGWSYHCAQKRSTSISMPSWMVSSCLTFKPEKLTLPEAFPDTSAEQNWETLSSESKNLANSSPEGSLEALVWSLQTAAKEVDIEERMKAVLRTKLIGDMVMTEYDTGTRKE